MTEKPLHKDTVQKKPTPPWHARKTIIRSATGDAYIVRWSIACPLFSVKLHHILRSDDDRDLHDHPWSFVSIILRGGYWEHMLEVCTRHPVPNTPHRYVGSDRYLASDGNPGCVWCYKSRAQNTVRRWFRPGRILWRPSPSVHRLELPEGKTAWSLVLTGPRVRTWGFHTICGFIPWMKYEAAKADGC